MTGKFNIKDLHEKVMPQGIYFNMPNEVYHADLSLSNSGMGKLLKSPVHYWHDSPMNPDREPLDTKALREGRILHTLLLEPEKFHREWEIKPNVKSTTVAGMVGEGVYNDLIKAVKSLRSDKIIASLFKFGYPEVSLFWIDEDTGVPCRMRTDYLSLNIAADLKGTANLDTYNLGYSIADYGYHRQDAFYLHGLAQVKKLIQNDTAIIKDCPNDEWLQEFVKRWHNKFVFVFQEKKAPFVTRAESLCDRTREQGMLSVQKAIYAYKYNYELYGTAPWPSGFEGRVGLLQLDDLPQRITFENNNL